MGFRIPSSYGHRNRQAVVRSAASGPERVAALRGLLARPGLLLGPAAYDGMSARLTELAGFDFAFMSGFSVSAARLAKPDAGLLSYTEMLDQGRCMHEATRSIPIIGDADTGYGNAMNVKRTVQGYAAAGFAGVLLEDQQWPKSCGHVRNKRVVPRNEAIARIEAACDARDEGGSGIVIVARTDARQAESFQEALYRAAAFADAGADVVFVDALESEPEMRTLCASLLGVSNVHTMANMLEGGGKTPLLTPEALEDMGYKLCAYPLSLLGVSVNAMRSALIDLKRGTVPMPPTLPAFSDLQALVGFPEYFDESAKYATQDESAKPKEQQQRGTDQIQTAPVQMAVDPDDVIEPSGFSRPPEDLVVAASTDDSSYESSKESNEAFMGRRALWLRIRISDAKSGVVKLDTRFPAGFLGSVAAIVPQVAGLDLQALVNGGFSSSGKGSNQAVFSLDADGDKIDVFLE